MITDNLNLKELQAIRICHNMIYDIMKKFYGVPKSDLYQAGVMGVLEALKNYQENKNCKFSTYAWTYIYGEMYALQASSKNINQNREGRKILKAINYAKERLTQTKGKEPTIKELADFLEIDEIVLSNVINTSKETLSLNYTNEENDALIDTIASNECIPLTTKIDLQNSIETLSPEEQNIIKYRYFNDYTQSEVAEKLGLTQVSVSRYEKRSLNKMKDYFTN